MSVELATCTQRHLVVRVTGDMDYSTDRVLRVRLTDLIGHYSPLKPVLDLSGVSFCDSAGLSVLLAAHRQTEAKGTTLALACVPQSLRLVLEMTGTHQVLRIFETVADAEASLDC
ncbi:STAS domain-containing protein [Streptomyces sp. TRM66268-LWL]|uniref:Anti-sigma factor antagonist n=1 Tax=Streptomyces polyasparticus TaxID=2767826 RepID=A0ABR7SUV4_9ACTN|nr:STAS domain-containing protein [Streptomyces polyasparticus]MBC9719270.1 STAS domain-containing protein [Streptomyces polyasparticus]